MNDYMKQYFIKLRCNDDLLKNTFNKSFIYNSSKELLDINDINDFLIKKNKNISFIQILDISLL